MKYLLKSSIVAAAALISFSASAHDDMSGVVKARHDIMNYIASNMRTLSQMRQGQIEYNAPNVRNTAIAIAVMAKSLPYLFPKDSINDAGSKASDRIVENPEGFFEFVLDLEEAALTLAEAAHLEKDLDSIDRSISELGATCRNCHSEFRK